MISSRRSNHIHPFSGKIEAECLPQAPAMKVAQEECGRHPAESVPQNGNDE